MVLKPGWLNRQFDQVSRNVDGMPEWMKRAAGIETKDSNVKQEQDDNSEQEEDEDHAHKGRLRQESLPLIA